jgi:hypothetical protein
LACSIKFFPKFDLKKANGLSEIARWLMTKNLLNPQDFSISFIGCNFFPPKYNLYLQNHPKLTTPIQPSMHRLLLKPFDELHNVCLPMLDLSFAI